MISKSNKIIKVFTAALFLFTAAHYCHAGEKETLAGKWDAENSFHYIGMLFDYSSYEEYKKDVFDLYMATAADSGARPGDYSVLELGEDGRFFAEDASYRFFADDEIKVYLTRWQGEWTEENGVLCLTVRETKNEGTKISDDKKDIQNITFRFEYCFADGKLFLKPLFNREAAYEIMSAGITEYENSPVLIADLGERFADILSASESGLNAYTVKKMLDAMEELKLDPENSGKNIALIKDVLKMWRDEKSGFPPKKISQEKIKASALQRKWHINGNAQDFMDMILPLNSCETDKLLLEKKYAEPHFSLSSETRIELDLREDRSLSMKKTVFVPHHTKPQYVPETEEFKGSWLLKDNAVEMEFSQPQQFKAGFKVSLENKKFYAVKNTPSEETYTAIKKLLSEKIAHKDMALLENIHKLLGGEYGTLAAHDIFRAKKLTDSIAAAYEAGKPEEAAEPAKELEFIADKWYKGFLEYNNK